MDNLYNQFKYILGSQEKWDYYLSHEQKKRQYPQNECEAKSFIQDYFKEGNKGSALKSMNTGSNSVVNIPRSEHMVCAFFLGILIYDQCCRIKNAINEKIRCLKYLKEQESDSQIFLYVWFLSCLYHDIGYNFESTNENTKKDTDLDNEVNKALQKLNFSKRCIPNRLFNNIKLYYVLRKLGKLDSFNDAEKIENAKKIDHGIIGGAKLYNNMAEMHKNDLQQVDGLLVGKPILSHYIAPASSAVMAHNMWFKEKNDHKDVSQYEKYLLHDLIYPANKRIIDLDNHPLLFLLCFVDTLEPLKKNKGTMLSSQCCLQNTSIDFNGNTIMFKSPVDNKITDNLRFLVSASEQPNQFVKIELPSLANRSSELDGI